MIAMEYMLMMSRMTMTVSATQPRCLIISLMVNTSLRFCSPGAGAAPPGCAAAWNRKTRTPRALLPRMLNRIVTVEILQRFSLMARALRQKGALRPAERRRLLQERATAADGPCPALLKHEVVRDDAGDLNRLPRQKRRREPRLPRRGHRRLLQERVAAHGAGRDDAPRLVHDDLHGHSALRARRLCNRRVGGLRLRDGLAVQHASRNDRLLRLGRGLRGRRGRGLFVAPPGRGAAARAPAAARADAH